jgi:hypothetical protein
MAKVLNEAARGCEPAHLMLSPSVRPCPLALADRDRRAELEPRDLTAWFFGDPLPDMSALDRRRHNERAHKINLRQPKRKPPVAVAGNDVGL